MKSIELKTGTQMVRDQETGLKEEKPFTTREIIGIILDTPPKNGFTLKDYRQRDRIQKVLDEKPNATVLELEDADFNNLKEISNETKWAGRNALIFDYLEALEKL